MIITIGDFSPDTSQVPVTFEFSGITHSRFVNAALDDEGNYDAEATEARCKEVSEGLPAKLAAGAIADDAAKSTPDA